MEDEMLKHRGPIFPNFSRRQEWPFYSGIQNAGRKICLNYIYHKQQSMSAIPLSRPVRRYLKDLNRFRNASQMLAKTFSSSPCRRQEVVTPASPHASSGPPFPLDPNTVHTPHQEKYLIKKRQIHPIGSRRRRAAIASSDNVPFEQLPYQCFQEARKVLAADREEKLQQIDEMRKRIAKWSNVPAEHQGGEYSKVGRLRSLHKHLEELKILADVNDPVIKKRFEDGMGKQSHTHLKSFKLTSECSKIGDMNRPIYRYLADQKWREYARKILVQRIEQHHIVPDMLHHVDPTAAVSLGFGRRNVQPGEFVDSRISEMPARLRIQAFDKGERLVTIAVMDPDVPDLEKDSYRSRCHFLSVNVPLSPTDPSVPLAHLNSDQHVIQPWLPPFSQKGAPYHRLAIFVLQQNGDAPLDVPHFRKFQTKRDGWNVKQLMTNHQTLTPIGVNLFRTQWDEGTDGVMQRAGIEGADVQFVRKKPEKNVYKKKDGSRYR